MPKAYISLYYSYREQLEILPDDERGRLIIALLDYAENGTIPTLEGASNMAFAFIKAQIDRDTEKYNERCQKNRDNIRKRWNPENTNEYDGIQSYTKHTKEKEKEKKKESIIGQPSVAEDTRPNFVPPTVEEVEAYCQERKNNISPQRFIDYYEARGWMLGSTPMENWKAAIRSWESGHTSGEPPDKPRTPKLRLITDESGNEVCVCDDR